VEIEDLPELLREHWALGLLVLLGVGLFFAVNANHAPEQTPVAPSVVLTASVKPLPATAGVQAQAGGVSVKHGIVFEDGAFADKTFLENNGTEEEKMVLLKFVPQDNENVAFSSSSGENERLGNVVETVFDVQPGETDFFEVRTPENESLPFFVYEDGAFSQDFESRLKDLLSVLGILPPELAEAALEEINRVLNDPTLSEQEKSEWVEAFVPAVLRLADSWLSTDKKVDAIHTLGDASADDIPQLVKDLEKPFQDTRACQRLPTALDVTVLKCANVEQPVEQQQQCSCHMQGGQPVWQTTQTQQNLPARVVEAPESGPFTQELQANQANKVISPCNPSQVLMPLHAEDDWIDKGLSLGRFSTVDLERLLEYKVARSDTVLDASFEVVMSEINFTPPWSQQTDGVEFANLTDTGASLPVAINPFEAGGNTFLSSLFDTDSISFNSSLERECIEKILNATRYNLNSRDLNVISSISLKLEPLEAFYNDRHSFACEGDACAVPPEVCAIRDEQLPVSFEASQAPGSVKVYSADGTVEWEGTLSQSSGSFAFTPTKSAAYAIEFGGGKSVAFTAKNEVECAPEDQEIPEECRDFIDSDNNAVVNAKLFEFANSSKCFEGVFTGIFGRVVDLPCNAPVKLCVKFLTLGRARDPLSSDFSPLSTQ